MTVANVDPAELAKFSALAHRWWDLDGEFAPLHQINPLRLDWIDRTCPLNGARVLDVRRPRIGQDLPPVSVQAGQPKDSKTHWHVPGTAMALLGGLLLVAD